MSSRAPQGARGLKYCLFDLVLLILGRAPQGARGLKSATREVRSTGFIRRAPQGARGLKFREIVDLVDAGNGSCPARGAWVEIFFGSAGLHRGVKSRPARGAWVEIYCRRRGRGALQSRPARGAWVEIIILRSCCHPTPGRAPQGARGLKCTPCRGLRGWGRRAPQGARGLKYRAGIRDRFTRKVAPRKGRVG